MTRDFLNNTNMARLESGRKDSVVAPAPTHPEGRGPAPGQFAPPGRPGPAHVAPSERPQPGPARVTPPERQRPTHVAPPEGQRPAPRPPGTTEPGPAHVAPPRDRNRVRLMWPLLRDRDQLRLMWLRRRDRDQVRLMWLRRRDRDPPRRLRLKLHLHLNPHLRLSLKELPLALPSLKKAVTVRKNISLPAGVFCIKLSKFNQGCYSGEE